MAGFTALRRIKSFPPSWRLLLTLLAKGSHGHVPLVYAFWAAWYVYFGWAASQFYAGSRMRSWIRGAVAAAIGHAAIIAALFAGSAAYESLVTRYGSGDCGFGLE
jgi:hypothetical protein